MATAVENPLDNWYIPFIRPVYFIALNTSIEKFQTVVGKDPNALTVHVEIMGHFTITYASATDRRNGGTMMGSRTPNDSSLQYSVLYLAGIVVLASVYKMIFR